MPRSKRNKPTEDFVRKRPKLGKKAHRTNQTDTSITKRQIHVPNQTRTTTTTTGLPLQDLLSRTRHHNPNTRITSLNTLTNALVDPNSTAHTAVTTPAPVITVACQSLSDPYPNVRHAALQLLKRLVDVVDVTPFRKTVTKLLQAGLTHINTAIKIDTATALTSLPLDKILSEGLLQSLSHLLVIPQPKAKIAALAAITSLYTHTPTTYQQQSGRFFYHRESCSPPVNHLHTLEEAEKATLVTRISEALLEQLHQPPRSIVTSCQALASVVEHGIPHQARNSVKRVLKNWRYSVDTYPLAKVALSMDDERLTIDYVISILQRDKYNDTLDNVIRDCVHVKKVSAVFSDKFNRAVHQHDTVFVRKSYKTAIKAMEECHIIALVRVIPQAVKTLKEGDEIICCGLVQAACAAWKAGINETRLAEELITVCTSPLVTTVVDQVIGVALCAGVLTGPVCATVLGECVRQCRMQVVDKFMDALEWIASTHGEDRLKAVALSRALGRVVDDAVTEDIIRPEAAAV